MNKYFIGNLEFDNKKEIIQHVRNILSKYKFGEAIDKTDFLFVYNLLQNHDNAEKKMGCGIFSFRKIKSSYGKGEFEIIRKDGSTTDFSYVKCITPRNKEYYVKSACRNAISPDILEFKVKYFRENKDNEGKILCPLTKQKIAINESHVDHAPPNTFEFIFRNWKKDRGIDSGSIEIIGGEDGEEKKSFKNHELTKSFIKYHNERANLRVVSAIGNLSNSKKQLKDFL